MSEEQQEPIKILSKAVQEFIFEIYGGGGFTKEEKIKTLKALTCYWVQELNKL